MDAERRDAQFPLLHHHPPNQTQKIERRKELSRKSRTWFQPLCLIVATGLLVLNTCEKMQVASQPKNTQSCRT
ncbi:unnamed protein product [Urochloa humidicola]